MASVAAFEAVMDGCGGGCKGHNGGRGAYNGLAGLEARRVLGLETGWDRGALSSAGFRAAHTGGTARLHRWIVISANAPRRFGQPMAKHDAQ